MQEHRQCPGSLTLFASYMANAIIAMIMYIIFMVVAIQDEATQLGAGLYALGFFVLLCGTGVGVICAYQKKWLLQSGLLNFFLAVIHGAWLAFGVFIFYGLAHGTLAQHNNKLGYSLLAVLVIICNLPQAVNHIRLLSPKYRQGQRYILTQKKMGLL